MAALIVAVGPPATCRCCSEVRPSPCTVASTYGESASSPLRMITPILRCGSVPAPTNFTWVRMRKSPLIFRHANWNSSRAAHMLVPPADSV